PRRENRGHAPPGAERGEDLAEDEIADDRSQGPGQRPGAAGLPLAGGAAGDGDADHREREHHEGVGEAAVVFDVAIADLPPLRGGAIGPRLELPGREVLARAPEAVLAADLLPRHHLDARLVEGGHGVVVARGLRAVELAAVE